MLSKARTEPSSQTSSRKENAAVTLWEVDIHPAASQPDLLARAATSEAADLGLPAFTAHDARGFLVQGEISPPQIDRIARELLTDLVVEHPIVGKPGEPQLCNRRASLGGKESSTIVHVLPKPGVTDPVAASALAAIRDFDMSVDAVVTLRKYWVSGLTESQLQALTNKLLANDSI